MILVGNFFTFWEWLYEASEFDKSITKIMKKEHVDDLKSGLQQFS